MTSIVAVDNDVVRKIATTVRDVLLRRGYTDVVDVDRVPRDAPVIEVAPGVTLVLHFTGRAKMADVVKVVSTYANKVVLLVMSDKTSDANVRQLVALAPPSTTVEVFEAAELLVNRARHRLVPEHEPVRDVDSVLASCRVKSRAQLPAILRTDIQARYLGLKPGDVVRITRTSPTAGEFTAYRVCV